MQTEKPNAFFSRFEKSNIVLCNTFSFLTSIHDTDFHRFFSIS